MPTYTARPVKVVAQELTERSWPLINDWLTAEGQEFYFLISGKTVTLHIKTGEGDRDCPVGYWVVKGTAGEFYPVAPEVFTAKYELVSDRVCRCGHGADDHDDDSQLHECYAEVYAGQLCPCLKWELRP